MSNFTPVELYSVSYEQLAPGEFRAVRTVRLSTPRDHEVWDRPPTQLHYFDPAWVEEMKAKGELIDTHDDGFLLKMDETLTEEQVKQQYSFEVTDEQLAELNRQCEEGNRKHRERTPPA